MSVKLKDILPLIENGTYTCVFTQPTKHDAVMDNVEEMPFIDIHNYLNTEVDYFCGTDTRGIVIYLKEQKAR